MKQIEDSKLEFIAEEHLVYLDKLRESGTANMLGAVPFILRQFPDLTEQQARQVLSYWMEQKVKKEDEMDKTDAFEKFTDMMKKVIWANPYLLGPNPEHVVYGLKIAAKMAKELWGWDDKLVEQAIQYAEQGIADDDFIRDVELLIQIWKQDWDMGKIRIEIDRRMGLA